VLDRSQAGRDLAFLVEAAVEAGVDWVQVRDRELSSASLLALTDEVRAAAQRGAARRAGSARVVVNRRTDVALAAGVDGVHLGFDAVTAADARTLLGPDALIGISAHSPEEIDPVGGASYAHLAPIAAPFSKPADRPPIGFPALGAAAARGLPVLAQGGIDVGNARAALAAGACGIAVTGAILLADDPGRATHALREVLDGTA
jgi:thiamine-phosphate pyrophosphorylase